MKDSEEKLTFFPKSWTMGVLIAWFVCNFLALSVFGIKECPRIPAIRVVSYSREDFAATGEVNTELYYSNSSGVLNFIQAPFVSIVGIECIASSPIEWIFDGVYNPPIQYLDIERNETDYDKPCFKIKINLKTTKKSTGTYRCRTLVGMAFSSKLHVYGDANGPPVLLNDKLNIEIVASENDTVILPCAVVNPSILPKLFKGNSEVIEIQGTLPFNPEIGFTLDLETTPHPFDNYKCRVTDDYVFISIKKLPDFQITPSTKRVVIVKDQNITLTCKGKDPVGLQGFLDDRLVTVEEFGDESEFKYSVSYHFLGNENAAITCLNLTSKKILHTWNCRVITPEALSSKGIFYDYPTNKFVCRSKTDMAPGISLYGCSNPVGCNFVNKCYTWEAPYKVEGRSDNNCGTRPNRGLECKSTDMVLFNSTLAACSYIDTIFDAGIVRCTFEGETQDQIVPFFKGIDRKTVITDIKTASPNQLMELGVDNRTLYVNETVAFNCTALKFINARGFHWMFEMNNGSSYINATAFKYQQNEDSQSLDPKSSYLTEYATLKIVNKEITAVVCLAPFWNTNEWLNISTKIEVKIGASPIISTPEENDTVTVYEGTNQTVPCEALGIPDPKIQWFRTSFDGKYDERTVMTDANNALHLGIVDKDDEGDYVCVASNVLGTHRRVVQLQVTESKNARGQFLLIVILVFFTCAVSIALVLWRKLYQNKKLIEKLTYREVKNFHDGDEKALLRAADGYIRAEYLRYDPGYEISEKDLVFGEELKRGQFGTVMKANFKRTNDFIQVAVKKPRDDRDKSHFKLLLSELKILTYIGMHDNIINLLGAVTCNLKFQNVYVVLEYCHLGSLEDFLRANSCSYLNQIRNDMIDFSLTFNDSEGGNYVANSYAMSTEDLIKWSHQITVGMEYLANRKVIHGDLAARNILLTENKIAKITDFGLSIHLYNDMSDTTHHMEEKLPWKWLAPETLIYCSFSTQSDVWAFGVTLYEIFSLGQVPYQNRQTLNPEFKSALLRGERLEKPDFASTQIYDQMLHCWQYSPAERISFEGLKNFFHRFLYNTPMPDLVPTPVEVPAKIYPNLSPRDSSANLNYIDPLTLQHMTSDD